MDSNHLPNCLAGGISIADHLNGLHHSTSKSDGFVVDMERFSHLIEKDANSRIKLQRNLSRKGSSRTAERKFADNETDSRMLTTSPRGIMKTAATFNGGSVPNKLAVEAPRPHGHSIAPQVHHQITISSGSLSSTTVAESKSGARDSLFGVHLLLCSLILRGYFTSLQPCHAWEPFYLSISPYQWAS